MTELIPRCVATEGRWSLHVLLSVALSVTTIVTPGLAQAAPPAEDSEAEVADELEPAADPAMAKAKELFDSGVARYTAADYGAAVDLWLEAYAMIPPSFDNRLIKAELIYNVARAQHKWFEIDQDVKHLRQSHETLERYLGEVDDLYGQQAPLEREKIQEQIDEVNEQITAWEAEQTRREDELAERMRPKFDEQADAREEKRNKSMVGAGAGLTALGFGGVGMLITGVILANGAQSDSAELPLEADIPVRESTISKGEAGNKLLVAGILSAGVLLAAGIPLLSVGASAEKKRKQRRADAGLERARVDGLAPIWIQGASGTGGAGGFAISGRF